MWYLTHPRNKLSAWKKENGVTKKDAPASPKPKTPSKKGVAKKSKKRPAKDEEQEEEDDDDENAGTDPVESPSKKAKVETIKKEADNTGSD